MTLKALLAGMFIVLASTAAQAQAVNHILVQLDDRTEGPIVAKTFLNGSLFDTHTFQVENAVMPFSLKPFGTVATSFDNQINFYEPGTRILSDTSEISGIAGNNFVSISLLSDAEGGPPPTALLSEGGASLSPLPNGGVQFETGGFQDISTFTASNGDVYTFQMASAVVEGIPEPATWAMMLLGLGGLGAAMRTTRRKAGAALAA